MVDLFLRIYLKHVTLSESEGSLNNHKILRYAQNDNAC